MQEFLKVVKDLLEKNGIKTSRIETSENGLTFAFIPRDSVETLRTSFKFS